ncbi:EmrB/QacA family drug resistance transporter [Planoprotostelium fungivorum]|uniref:EmrB/QacA family drug resistance transporter n=1 Tax=Planoprotostelium fungivorum TaxID=1890364 RepID=A0A2P6MWM0_9EUKA|nr:EmrB/QacA family drug resistance transporter [Planoprotostelium fungivorum]
MILEDFRPLAILRIWILILSVVHESERGRSRPRQHTAFKYHNPIEKMTNSMESSEQRDEGKNVNDFVMVDLKEASTSSGPPAAPSGQPDVIMGWRNVVAYLAILLGLFLAAIDNTIVATALPDITSDFKAADLYSWVIVAYLLTSTAVTPLVFMVSIAIFLASSAVCGAAVHIYMLIVFRAIQGISGGFILSGALIIVSDWFPVQQRAKFSAFIGLTFSVANVVGPVVGGAFSLNVSWRWVFYINLPGGGLSLVLVYFFLNYEAERAGNAATANAAWNQAAGSVSTTLSEKLKQIDYVGVFLILATVSCLVLGLSLGGNQFEWKSAPVIVLLAACGPLFAALIFWELKIAKNPVLALRIFARRAVSLTSIGVLLLGAVLTGLVNYLPVYFQIVRGDNPVISGVKLIPIMVCSVIPTIASGRIIAKFGYHYPWPIAGFAFCALAGGLLTTISEGTAYPVIGFFLALIGIGLGCIIQVMFFVSQAWVQPREIPLVSSLVTFFRTLGGVFGVTIFQTIITNTLSDDLKDPRLVHAVNQGYTFIQTLSVEVQSSIYAAYLHGLHLVFWAAFALSITGLILVIAIPRKRIPCEMTKLEEEKKRAAEAQKSDPEAQKLDPERQEKGMVNGRSHSGRHSAKTLAWIGTTEAQGVEEENRLAGDLFHTSPNPIVMSDLAEREAAELLKEQEGEEMAAELARAQEEAQRFTEETEDELALPPAPREKRVYSKAAVSHPRNRDREFENIQQFSLEKKK